MICGRKQEPLDQVARELSALAGRIVPIACHVGRLDDLERMVDRATREFGQIDILVNNAGTNIAQGPALEMTDAPVRQNGGGESQERLPAHAPGGSGDVRARVRIHHQHRVHRRHSSAIPQPALQHDQGRADHADAILRAGARPARRARECHRAGPGGDNAERVLLERRFAFPAP